MRLVYVHGWGFGADFWQPLEEQLGAGQCLDLGYHGASALEISAPDAPYVAIGHSFGVMWLLRHCADHPWRALISINGFARFTKAEGFEDGVHPRILTRMIKGFDGAPEAVYGDFLKLCGQVHPRHGDLDAPRLLADLNALADWDERETLARCSAPVLALAGGADQVVPRAMSAAAFAAHTLEILDGGDHLLPQSAPAWCAERIGAFLHEVGP